MQSFCDWRLRIESQMEASGSVLAAVADAGTGFDPDVADRIFDRLFTTKANGMGLGLSICQSIIDFFGRWIPDVDQYCQSAATRGKLAQQFEPLARQIRSLQ
jgi:C4-dicarboxylate-specific signal transduction histidine kinase